MEQQYSTLMILMHQCYSCSGTVVHLLITEVRGEPTLCVAFSAAEEHSVIPKMKYDVS